VVVHARRTRTLLDAWGGSASLCHAGLLHSVYACVVTPDIDGRRIVANLAGDATEAIVHATAFTPRAEIERRLLTPSSVPAGSVWADCALLTLASDIALLGRVPLPARQLESVRHLATLCLPLIRPERREEVVRLFRLAEESDPRHWVRRVRDAFDTIAARHQQIRKQDSDDVRILDVLFEVLPGGSRVLDLGCGDGSLISRRLAERFAVVGLDISWQQLRLAREALDSARWVCGDLLHLPYCDASFDGVCCYYSIIHLPRATHALAAHQIRRVLRPGGWALLCLGARDVPARCEPDFVGAPMWFSHYDREENLRLLMEHGFAMRWSYVVGEDTPANFLFALVQTE